MPSSLAIGIAAAIAAAVLGAGWQLASRHGVTSTLAPPDLAVLRYAIPALLLAPLLWTAPLPRIPLARLAVLVVGSGLPFGLLVLAGAQYAPAAHMGIFMAGTLPIFTALVGLVAMNVPVARERWFGYALIAVAVLASGLAGTGWHPGSWRGDLLFVAAAALWAVYTHAFRGSGLTPLQAAAVVNVASALLLLVMAPFWMPQKLWTAPLADVLFQALWQGVLAGLLGLVAYMVAVARLGAARAALSAAAVPVLSTIGGAMWLGEALTAANVIAALAVSAGLVVAAR